MDSKYHYTYSAVENYWIAQSIGPERLVLAEGNSQQEAYWNCKELLEKQLRSIKDKLASMIRNYLSKVEKYPRLAIRTNFFKTGEILALGLDDYEEGKGYARLLLTGKFEECLEALEER